MFSVKEYFLLAKLSRTICHRTPAPFGRTLAYVTAIVLTGLRLSLSRRHYEGFSYCGLVSYILDIQSLKHRHIDFNLVSTQSVGTVKTKNSVKILQKIDFSKFYRHILQHNYIYICIYIETGHLIFKIILPLLIIQNFIVCIV